MGGSAEVFKHIMDAYSVVGQPSSRTEYDRSLVMRSGPSMYRPFAQGPPPPQPKRPSTAGTFRDTSSHPAATAPPRSKYEPFGGFAGEGGAAAGPPPPDRRSSGGFSFTAYYYDRMKQAASGFQTTAAPPPPKQRPSTASFTRPAGNYHNKPTNSRPPLDTDNIPNDDGSSDEDGSPRPASSTQFRTNNARPFSAGIHKFDSRYQAFRDAMRNAEPKAPPCPPPYKEAPKSQPQPQTPSNTAAPTSSNSNTFDHLFNRSRPSTAKARFAYTREEPTTAADPPRAAPSPQQIPRPAPSTPFSAHSATFMATPAARPPMAPSAPPKPRPEDVSTRPAATPQHSHSPPSSRRPATATVRTDVPPSANNSVASRYDAYLSRILQRRLPHPVESAQREPTPTPPPSDRPQCGGGQDEPPVEVVERAPPVPKQSATDAPSPPSHNNNTPSPIDEEEREIEARYAHLMARLSNRGM